MIAHTFNYQASHEPEPLMLSLSDLHPDDDRRPDALLRNPYGGGVGKQAIVDIAVDGSSTRRLHDLASSLACCRFDKISIAFYTLELVWITRLFHLYGYSRQSRSYTRKRCRRAIIVEAPLSDRV